MVDIAAVAPFDEPLTRDELKTMKALEGMMLLQRGSRLSIQPVTAAQWKAILKRGGVEAKW